MAGDPVRGEIKEIGRAQVTQGLGQDVRFYPEYSGKPCGGLEQRRHRR